MFAVLVAVFLFLRFTTLGRYTFATGGNEDATRLSGVPVRQVKVALYALNGLLAGVVLTGIF